MELYESLAKNDNFPKFFVKIDVFKSSGKWASKYFII